MKNGRIYLLGVVLAAFSMLAACAGEEIIADTFSALEQFETEKELIRDYLALNQFEEDTTDRGVRLVVIDPGTGSSPEVSDIVYFDYAGRFLNRGENDEVLDTAYFDTSVFSIAAEEQGVEDDNPLKYRPIVYAYSTDGWTLTSQSGGNNWILGFQDGVTEIMKKLKVGGKGEILIPSNMAYGVLGTTGIPANQTLIFEIFLRRVDK
ncbi:MAG: FKBP-type peptidyl-prolyl cis-trans isomerase [Bacteroidota bacterium]